MSGDLRRNRTLFAPLALSLLLAALLAIAVSASAEEACTGPCLPGDRDGDTIKDWADNCPENGNRRQPDNDMDTPAPVFDLKEDTGQDVPEPAGTLLGPVRIYPTTPVQTGNSAPTDMSETQGGDECDLDDDNDGVYDKRKAGKPGPDNCRKTANTDQKDSDKDGVGDACDPNNDPIGGGTAKVPSVDTSPLKVSIGKTARMRFSELGLGLPVPAKCSRNCTLVAELALDRKSSKKLRLPAATKRLPVGRGTAALEGKGTTYVIVRIRKKTLTNLQRRLKTLRPVLVVSTLGDGAKRITERRLLIRR